MKIVKTNTTKTSSDTFDELAILLYRSKADEKVVVSTQEIGQTKWAASVTRKAMFVRGLEVAIESKDGKLHITRTGLTEVSGRIADRRFAFTQERITELRKKAGERP